MTVFSSKSTFSSKATKTVAALVAACTLGLATAPSAEAGWHGRHYGYGAAALGGGLLLGALIASNSRPAYGYARDCWLERQKRYDVYGNRYYVKVKVCD